MSDDVLDELERRLATDAPLDDLLDALSAPARRELATLRLVAALRLDEAAALTPSPELRLDVEAAPADDVLAEDDPDDPDALDLRPTDEGDPDELLVERFLRFFGGRRDLYARQWHDDKRGRGGYRPVRNPLTADVARDHLRGRLTLGQYPLGPDGRVSFGVLDLDLGSQALERLEATHGDANPLRHDGLRAYLQRLRQAAVDLGLAAFPAASGGRGAHLWLFFDPPRPARAVRQALKAIVTAAGGPPADVTLELFPKQIAAGPRGLSSLVKLPLGIHQRTLRPCPLLDDGLASIEDPAAALARLRFVDNALLDALLGGAVRAFPAPELADPPGPLPPLPDDPTPRSLGEALRATRDDASARLAQERMLSGCATLSAIVDRAFSERRLDADEARAVAYSIGLLGDGKLAEEILLAASATLKELHRARRGVPSPVGCRKLRGLRSTPCSGCPSLEGQAPYPTPVLYALGPIAPKPRRSTRHAPHLDADEQVVEGALDGIGHLLRRIEARLERLERRADDDPQPSALGDADIPAPDEDPF
ncbi:MAG: hypothetical protein KF901_25220 [Myxococcales bacterium]|nr:hypothetical protein [Myxococcales bacterium]